MKINIGKINVGITVDRLDVNALGLDADNRKVLIKYPADLSTVQSRLSVGRVANPTAPPYLQMLIAKEIEDRGHND